MSSKNIVAFIGENENGILREASLDIMKPLAARGLSGHVININAPNWPELLAPIVDDGILMAWGLAGIGSELGNKGMNLWESLRVPFVSCMADCPCYFPTRHQPQSPFVALGYFIEEWLDIQTRFIKSPRLSGMLPIGLIPNPHRDGVAWLRRTHRMIFVKTGDSPAARRAGWAKLPTQARAVLEECADEACRNGVMGLTDLFVSSIRNRGLQIKEGTQKFFSLMMELDQYVRAVRATRMAEALCHVPAIIIGRGWDHIDKANAKAQFYPAIDAAELPKLFADSQFVVNTTPNYGSAPHERMLYGFTARACVLSDQNNYTRSHFAGLPSFFGVDIPNADLAGQIAAIWADPTDYGEATNAALTLVETNHAPEKFIESLIKLGMSATGRITPVSAAKLRIPI